MAGSFLIASGHVDIEARTQDAVRSITGLVTKLVAVGPAAGGAATIVAGALGSVTAGVVAAGAATGVFAAAAKPQLQSVTDVTKLYTDAQTAAANGASDAAEKQKAYEQALAKLPPATRETAKAFIGLKDDTKKWSDSLAGTTMPVFTKGIEVLRDLLPQLSPLVKTAGGAFSDFMDGLKTGVNSGGFKTFMDKLNQAAKESLPDLLSAGKEVFRGIGGIIEAFLPTAGDATGKIADMAKSFGDWGQNLENSQGFKDFLAFIRENGPKISETLGSLVDIGGKLWEAFAPLASIQLTFLQALADFVSKLPPPVILGLALALAAMKLALMGFGIYTALANAGLIPLIASTWAWTTALLANPMTWIVLGIIALIAVIVLIATKTDWFQRLWSAAWGWIKSTWDTVWGGLKAGWEAMGRFFTETIPGWLSSLKNWFSNKWNEIRDKVASVLSAIRDKISSIWTSIVNTVRDKITGIVNRVRDGFNSARNYVADIGSRIVTAVRNAFNSMVNAVRDKVNTAVQRVKDFKGKVTSFFSGAGSWLVSSGRKLIQGFIDGIRNMAGSVRDAVSNVLQGARNLLPFSPAKEGPFSGKGWTEYSGASLMQGLATGIDNSAGIPHQSMSKALGGVSGATSLQPVAAAGGSSLHIENLTLNLDGKWDLTKPDQNKAAAKLLAKNMTTELRNYEKERR